MTSSLPIPPPDAAADAVPVFFISDSTGISAETMGNALLLQFPSVPFERRLIPFLRSVDEAREVRRALDAAMDGPLAPIVFLTVVDEAVREELLATRAPVVDFVSGHLAQLEAQLGVTGDHAPARLHGVGDSRRYNRRMQAVEFAIEHDDGQSVRAIEKADVVLIAPSRCGKTPTSMYLALMHGVFVANYPLVDEDLAGEVRGAACSPRRSGSARCAPSGAPAPATPPSTRPAAVPGPARLRRARHRPRRLLEQVSRGDVHPDPPVERRGTSAR
jgi:hypothetical protein